MHIGRNLEGLGSEVVQIACKLAAGAVKCCKAQKSGSRGLDLGIHTIGGGLSNREPESYIPSRSCLDGRYPAATFGQGWGSIVMWDPTSWMLMEILLNWIMAEGTAMDWKPPCKLK